MLKALPFQLPRVIAHRGDRAHAPENTRAAIRQAALKGIRWVEFDATLCADTQKPVVIFHDDTTGRTTDGEDRPLTDISFDELRQRDAGGWFDSDFRGEKVPTLIEVLEDCAELDLCANVEIKVSSNRETNTPEPFDDELARLTARRVLEDIARGLGQRRSHSLVKAVKDNIILLSSFSTEALLVAKAQRPDLPRGYLLHKLWADEAVFRDRLHAIAPQTLNLNHELLETADSVKWFRNVMRQTLEREIPILCYTVNDPERAKTLFSWGVSSIFADDPGAMLQALK